LRIVLCKMAVLRGTMMKHLLIVAAVMLPTWTWAQEHGHTAPAHESGAPHAEAAHASDPSPHPTLSHDPDWAVPVVVVIGAMFAAAWVIGAAARANMEEELPPTHSHDEPPGASGHHGHGGTVDHSDPDHH
jgi:hypothetical protein